MATAETTSKVTRPTRKAGRVVTPKTTPKATAPVAVDEPTPETVVVPTSAPVAEPATMAEPPKTEAAPVVVVQDDAGMRKEGFVLESTGASKNFAKFSIPEGTGCVTSTLYVPLDTVEVKLLLVRKSA